MLMILKTLSSIMSRCYFLVSRMDLYKTYSQNKKYSNSKYNSSSDLIPNSNFIFTYTSRAYLVFSEWLIGLIEGNGTFFIYARTTSSAKTKYYYVSMFSIT